MAANTATDTDLSRRSLRPLTDQETTVGAVLLEDAFRRIVTEVPAVDALLDEPAHADPSDPLRLTVIQVQAQMVLRVIRNPDGVLEESTDDYTRRLDAAVSTGALYMTDDERGLLAVATGTGGSSGSGGIVTVRARPVRVIPGRPGASFPTTSTDTW